ncbi:MAG: ATP-binding cassette domain-containing protein [Gammaproteobacteria bacterium]
MSNEILIRVEHLWRYYGTGCAVRDVSFEVRRGEVLGFLGPNGAGKSTIMQIISGNLAPSSGRVWINGVDLLDEPKRAKAALGFLPEQPPLYRELTVDEYLLYCARLHRIPRNQQTAALATAKQRCGLTDVGRRLIGNLSKGYQQRVGIAQAIIHAPAVVILDEPTVGLDPIQIREIRDLICELRGAHSIILSTHILPEVQATCDRVQIINRGELILADTTAGLMRRMQTSSLLIGLRRPPTLDVLLGIAGVEGVEQAENNLLRLHYAAGQNPAETVVKLSVSQDWGLYELSAERISLEQIFVDITRSEAAEPHAA